VHAGRVFVVNAGDGTVSVLDARTGAVQRTVTIGALRPQSLATYMNSVDVVADEHGGRAVVVSGSAVDRNGIPLPGGVTLLDARSGRVLRTVTVGRIPMAVAVDDTTARLFVVNNGPEGGPGRQTVWRWWIPPRLWRWLPQPSPQPHTGNVTVLG
jgi:YVTN family beta-propeller protein